MQRIAAQIAAHASPDSVSPDGGQAHFEVPLGTPQPLLPAPARLLPVWQEALRTGNTRALTRMLPPDLKLRGRCIQAPGSHAIETAGGLWERTVPGAVARMWTDPQSPQNGLFDSLLPPAGSRNAYWLDTHVLFSDFLGYLGFGWRHPEGPGFRFCLVPVDEAWKRSALERTARASDCWKGGLAERLTRPRTCRPAFPDRGWAGSVYGPAP